MTLMWTEYFGTIVCAVQYYCQMGKSKEGDDFIFKLMMALFKQFSILEKNYLSTPEKVCPMKQMVKDTLSFIVKPIFQF